MGSYKVLKFFSCYKMSEVEIEVEADVEVGVDVDAEVEVEVDADCEIEVEVEVPDVEVEVEGGLDAGLEIEAEIEVPLVEAEVGGSSQGGSGGVCNLVCAILFFVIFLGDLGLFMYYLLVSSAAFPHPEGWSVETTRTVTCATLGGALALWFTLAMCCCCCYNKSKRPGGMTNVEPVSYEMGGCAEVDIE